MMISIVVPLHNEEKNIPLLVENINKFKKANNLNIEVVLVNDNSLDKTSYLCNEYQRKFSNYKCIHRKNGNNGMGFALKEGTKVAKGEIVVWVMGDLSDDLNVIKDFIKKINNGADLVVGSRYMKGGTAGNMSKFKAFCSYFFGFLTRILYGINIHDTTNAFRGFRKSIFNKLDIDSGDFGISLEFVIKAHKKRFKIEEVPASYKNRLEGKADFKMIDMGIKYITILLKNFF